MAEEAVARRALERLPRERLLTRKLSITVGWVRVCFAVLLITQVEWLFTRVPWHIVFWAYLLVASIGLALIYAEKIRREVRAFCIGLVDVVVVTYFVYMLGTFSFVTLGYSVQGALYALSVSRRVALALWSFGAATYLALVLAVSSGWLPRGPYAPVWPNALEQSPPLALAVAGSITFVSYVAIFATNLLSQRLGEERQLSDALLLNVLPAPIVERLKDSTERIAERVDSATVLFADLAGFTPLSSKLSAEEVVHMLDDLFSRFDALAERHGLEKIKTIGDAYMAAAGIPTPRADHVRAVADMALAMLDVAREATGPDGSPLQLRIGIHTGPVVAGVIGRQKFTYDLWGDTVNLASRLESHGMPGRIHVSSAVKDALGSDYVLEPRGTIEIKGKGPLPTFFLVESS